MIEILEWLGTGFIIVVLLLAWSSVGHYCGECNKLMEIQGRNGSRVWKCQHCGKVDIV